MLSSESMERNDLHHKHSEVSKTLQKGAHSCKAVSPGACDLTIFKKSSEDIAGAYICLLGVSFLS